MDFAQRCQAYRDIASRAPADPEELARASSAVIDALAHVDVNAMRDELSSLLRLVDAEDPYVSARTALLLGAFVENDLPPLEVSGNIVSRYKTEAEKGKDYYALLRKEDERLETTGERSTLSEGQTLMGGDYAVSHRFAQAAAEHMPRAAAAYFSSDTLWLPIVACLTRDHQLRREAREDQELVAAAREYRFDHAKWLYALLSGAANEEWVVLHVPSERGFAVRAVELVDNFAIQPLLANALADHLGLAPVNPRVLACLRGDGDQAIEATVQGLFETYTHGAIAPTGALVEELNEHKVWNEGLPEDIPAVEGKRVIVLGKAKVKRTWRAQRAFGLLGSDIRLERELGRDEYRMWLERCASGTLH